MIDLASNKSPGRDTGEAESGQVVSKLGSSALVIKGHAFLRLGCHAVMHRLPCVLLLRLMASFGVDINDNSSTSSFI